MASHGPVSPNATPNIMETFVYIDVLQASFCVSCTSLHKHSVKALTAHKQKKHSSWMTNEMIKSYVDHSGPETKHETLKAPIQPSIPFSSKLGGDIKDGFYCSACGIAAVKKANVKNKHKRSKSSEQTACSDLDNTVKKIKVQVIGGLVVAVEGPVEEILPQSTTVADEDVLKALLGTYEVVTPFAPTIPVFKSLHWMLSDEETERSIELTKEAGNNDEETLFESVRQYLCAQRQQYQESSHGDITYRAQEVNATCSTKIVGQGPLPLSTCFDDTAIKTVCSYILFVSRCCQLEQGTLYSVRETVTSNGNGILILRGSPLQIRDIMFESFSETSCFITERGRISLISAFLMASSFTPSGGRRSPALVLKKGKALEYVVKLLITLSPDMSWDELRPLISGTVGSVMARLRLTMNALRESNQGHLPFKDIHLCQNGTTVITNGVPVKPSDIGALVQVLQDQAATFMFALTSNHSSFATDTIPVAMSATNDGAFLWGNNQREHARWLIRVIQDCTNAVPAGEEKKWLAKADEVSVMLATLVMLVGGGPPRVSELMMARYIPIPGTFPGGKTVHYNSHDGQIFFQLLENKRNSIMNNFCPILRYMDVTTSRLFLRYMAVIRPMYLHVLCRGLGKASAVRLKLLQHNPYLFIHGGERLQKERFYKLFKLQWGRLLGEATLSTRQYRQWQTALVPYASQHCEKFLSQLSLSETMILQAGHSIATANADYGHSRFDVSQHPLHVQQRSALSSRAWFDFITTTTIGNSDGLSLLPYPTPHTKGWDKVNAELLLNLNLTRWKSDHQQRAVRCCFEHKSVLVNLATGGGKSVVAASVARYSVGNTLLIVPYVALQINLCNSFRRLGLSVADPNTLQGRDFGRSLLPPPGYVGADIVVIVADRLLDASIKTYIQQAKNTFAAVIFDEAHTWAEDWRAIWQDPELKTLLSSLSGKRIILSATIPPSIRSVIYQRIGLPDGGENVEEVVGNLDRPELQLRVVSLVENSNVGLNDAFKLVFSQVLSLIKQVVNTAHPLVPGKILVFCPLLALVQHISSRLEKELRHSASVLKYYSGCGLSHKHEVTEEFTRQPLKTTIMVSTSGFGIGVDIPGVSHVIVAGGAYSLLQVAQFFGRAGRNGEESHGHLLWSRTIHRRLTSFVTEPDVLVKNELGLDAVQAFVMSSNCLRSFLKARMTGITVDVELCDNQLLLCSSCSKSSISASPTFSSTSSSPLCSFSSSPGNSVGSGRSTSSQSSDTTRDVVAVASRYPSFNNASPVSDSSTNDILSRGYGQQQERYLSPDVRNRLPSPDQNQTILTILLCLDSRINSMCCDRCGKTSCLYDCQPELCVTCLHHHLDGNERHIIELPLRVPPLTCTTCYLPQRLHNDHEFAAADCLERRDVIRLTLVRRISGSFEWQTLAAASEHFNIEFNSEQSWIDWLFTDTNLSPGSHVLLALYWLLVELGDNFRGDYFSSTTRSGDTSMGHRRKRPVSPLAFSTGPLQAQFVDSTSRTMNGSPGGGSNPLVAVGRPSTNNQSGNRSLSPFSGSSSTTSSSQFGVLRYAQPSDHRGLPEPSHVTSAVKKKSRNHLWLNSPLLRSKRLSSSALSVPTRTKTTGNGGAQQDGASLKRSRTPREEMALRVAQEFGDQDDDESPSESQPVKRARIETAQPGPDSSSPSDESEISNRDVQEALAGIEQQYKGCLLCGSPDHEWVSCGGHRCFVCGIVGCWKCGRSQHYLEKICVGCHVPLVIHVTREIGRSCNKFRGLARPIVLLRIRPWEGRESTLAEASKALGIKFEYEADWQRYITHENGCLRALKWLLKH